MRAPVFAVGDSALGCWPALREVFPDSREQRDWVHKTANVLAALPKFAHPGAKAALAEICNAEGKRHGHVAAKRESVQGPVAGGERTTPGQALVRAGATFINGQLVERPAGVAAQPHPRQAPGSVKHDHHRQDRVDPP